MMRAEPIANRPDIVKERGIALIAALMIMLLMSALMIGFTSIVMSDQRYRGIDKDRARAYYGAQSGLEKLSTDLGLLFLDNVAPTAAQVADLANHPPTIPNVTFVAPAGVVAYGVTPALIDCPPAGLVATCSGAVATGPYQGLIALKKKYDLDAVARTTSGGEAHLKRSVESVAIPVFQFGTFSDVDLSLFAGGAFSFGGRIHTNANLFLTAQDGGTTTITDKVTAVGDVIRARMQNGLTLATAGFSGILKMATAPNTFRNLLAAEGSLVDGIGSAPNTVAPNNWQTISIGTYNGYIRNGGCPPPGGCPVPPAAQRGTGAKRLDLSMVNPVIGGQNTDMSRRPPATELASSPLFAERMFGQVSVRILLSDTAADITGLPTVTATAPVHLGDEVAGGYTNDWATTPPAGYGPVNATHPPIARSPGLQTITTSGATAAGATTIPVVGANPTGIFNVPGTAGPVSSMRFQVSTGIFPLLVNLQTINCLTVAVTSATQITFGNCLRANAAGGLLAVPNGSTITITDTNGKTQNFLTTGGAVANTTNNTTTRNYVVTSTPTTQALIMNTFWMKSSTADRAWSQVTCSGFTTGTNTANAGPFAITAFAGCEGVPVSTAGVGVITTGALNALNVGTIGGYLKVEIQKADFTWQDVTMEILNWGFADKNQEGDICDDPTPNAILRIQRLRDNGGNCHYSLDGTNGVPVSTNSYDYWPNTLFDTREGLLRNLDPGNNDVAFSGVMHYIGLDVANLNKWLKGVAPYGAGQGVNALQMNGYSVYFSDRRNNRADGTNGTVANGETGEYGFEDVVNPLSAAGTPNGTLDDGEDVNANTFVDLYGKLTNFLGVRNTIPPFVAVAPAQAVAAPFNSAATILPWTSVGRSSAMTSRPYFFRRALKLMNGGLTSFTSPGVIGLSIITENPVYIHGDWNWNATADLDDPHAETSVIADAVTLLSNNWRDFNSFLNPYDATQRTRSVNWYRLAIIAGKGKAFPWPAAGTPDGTFGTDGGAHNFLRYLEQGNGTTNYRGAIATFYYSRQAVGTYKFDNNPPTIVYAAPTRAYDFDTDFLDPAKLPPLTPVFRDINALGFSQEIRPGR
jgi:hypothetical protein